MTEPFPPESELIQLDQIRINRNLDKLCKCQNRKFVLDTTNKRVTCASCGSVVDPYDALLDVSKWMENNNEALKRQREQAVELSNYKPWLKVIKYLESQYRGRQMLPNCPRCGEPFYLEELTSWSGKEWADRRIQAFKDK